jgi:hypothetical protein
MLKRTALLLALRIVDLDVERQWLFQRVALKQALPSPRETENHTHNVFG